MNLWRFSGTFFFIQIIFLGGLLQFPIDGIKVYSQISQVRFKLHWASDSIAYRLLIAVAIHVAAVGDRGELVVVLLSYEVWLVSENHIKLSEQVALNKLGLGQGVAAQHIEISSDVFGTSSGC